MTTYDFDRIVDRTGTYSLKWENMTAALPGAPADALPLWVADMDFPCAEPIIKALHERTDRLIFGYSLHQTAAYYDAISGWFHKRFGWQLTPQNIFYSPGVVPAIGFLIDLLSEPGDGIIIQPPVYYPFAQKIQDYDRQVVTNPLQLLNGVYTMDYADLETKLSCAQNKGLILCSPHNPVGRIWQPEELQQVVELCQKYDKWIISDEIHCDIVRHNQTHTPLEKLCPDFKNRIFTCTAPSKTFNLAGLQLSNIIINDPAVQALWNERIAGRIGLRNPNVFAITATITAYTKGEEWLDQVNAYIDANIAYVEEFIAQNLPLVKVLPCQGTYLMWLDFTAYGLDAETLEHKMLNEAKIALDEGKMFGAEGRGFERFNVACPRPILEDCMARLKQTFG